MQENERHLYQLFTNQLNTGWIKYFCRWKKPYLNDWILRFQKAILVWFQITPIISDLTIHMRKFQHAQDLLVLIYPKLHSKSCDYLYSLTAWYPPYCLKGHIQNKNFWKVISIQVCTTTTFVSCFHDLHCTIMKHDEQKRNWWAHQKSQLPHTTLCPLTSTRWIETKINYRTQHFFCVFHKKWTTALKLKSQKFDEQSWCPPKLIELCMALCCDVMGSSNLITVPDWLCSGRFAVM